MKGNFRRFINDFKFWSFSQEDDVVTQNRNIPLNATGSTGNVLSSSLLISSNNSEEKDPQSFLKDLRINNINRLIIGELNINCLSNKFDQLSIMTSGNIDILRYLKQSSTKLFYQRSFCYKVFACLTDLVVMVMVVALYVYARENIPSQIIERKVQNNIEYFLLKSI